MKRTALTRALVVIMAWIGWSCGSAGLIGKPLAPSESDAAKGIRYYLPQTLVRLDMTKTLVVSRQLVEKDDGTFEPNDSFDASYAGSASLETVADESQPYRLDL